MNSVKRSGNRRAAQKVERSGAGFRDGVIAGELARNFDRTVL